MRRFAPVTARLLILLLTLLLLGGCLPAVNAPESAPAVTQVPVAPEGPELVLLTPEPGEASSPEATAAPTPNGTSAPTDTPAPTATAVPVTEDGIYDSKDEVALYLHLYGHLPSNYITKSKARKLGWNGGSLEPYAPGRCIGGGEYLNLERLLPEAPGRIYYECDIDTLGANKRGGKRIVFSNDGLIYYTGNHYESFTLLYGEE